MPDFGPMAFENLNLERALSDGFRGHHLVTAFPSFQERIRVSCAYNSEYIMVNSPGSKSVLNFAAMATRSRNRFH